MNAPKYKVGDHLIVDGKFGGKVHSLITLEPAKWDKEGKTRYQYVIFHSCGVTIVDEEKLKLL